MGMSGVKTLAFRLFISLQESAQFVPKEPVVNEVPSLPSERFTDACR